MSEAITGYGDRMRVSVAGGTRFSVDGRTSTQINNGVSARLSPDLVDGDLILAPHVGFAYSRVEAKRRKEVWIDLAGRHDGWGGPEEYSYFVDVERAKANRFTPSVGFSAGWLSEERHGEDFFGALGAQAMVEVRRDFLGDYEIEQYPDRTVAVDGKDAKSWGLRAGGELLLEPYRFGEKGNGSGLGILVGAYWVMDTNPATREGGKDSVEVSAGLLWTFE